MANNSTEVDIGEGAEDAEEQDDEEQDGEEDNEEEEDSEDVRLSSLLRRRHTRHLLTFFRWSHLRTLKLFLTLQREGFST